MTVDVPDVKGPGAPAAAVGDPLLTVSWRRCGVLYQAGRKINEFDWHLQQAALLNRPAQGELAVKDLSELSILLLEVEPGELGERLAGYAREAR